MDCNSCHQKLGKPVYTSTIDRALSSLCEVINGSASVYFCDYCGHCYTPPLHDITDYYSQQYKILIASEDEDQMVFFPDGRTLFRFDLQVENLLNTIALDKRTKLLDYGCAKSTTIKKLCRHKEGLIPHLFDVSNMYIPFWKSFASPENWATFQINPEWKSYFDIVTSFFSLEHVADPGKMIAAIHHVLNDTGTLYCVVPNMYSNTADLVVADHVNHFSPSSIRYILNKNGFTKVDIDTKSHYGAYIITAVKQPGKCKAAVQAPDSATVLAMKTKLMPIASYWSKISEKIIKYESDYSTDESIAIYGSGFYGAYVASCLKRFEQVACFIDQNPHRHTQTLYDRPIVPPTKLPGNIRYIHVGLNPAIAKSSIAAIECWKNSGLVYNYL